MGQVRSDWKVGEADRLVVAAVWDLLELVRTEFERWVSKDVDERVDRCRDHIVKCDDTRTGSDCEGDCF